MQGNPWAIGFIGGAFLASGVAWLIEPASPLRQVTDAYVCGYVDAVADVATKHNTPIERPKILGCPTARDEAQAAGFHPTGTP